MTHDYRPPVDQLLTLGKPDGGDWPDYLALGMSREQVPELIRMATDEALNEAPGDSVEVWAPLHAWRSLGQLRAEAAIEPLFALLRRLEEGDDWVSDELPEVYGMIGPAAIPALTRYLSEPAHGVWARISAVSAVGKIGEAHPDAREQTVAALTAQLELAEAQDDGLNGFLVSRLLDLDAVESLDTIREAFRKGAVDPMIVGDFQDVEIEMGLRQRRTGPRRDRGPLALLEGERALPEPDAAAWARAGRNEPCPCGSGIKYKKCCLKKRAA
jgi:hypothetical protein